MGERFEKMLSELKGSLKDASVEVDDIEPSTSKPSPIKPSPSKPSSSKPPLSIPSPRRSKRLDVNLSQADDMDEDIGTQGLEGLSQSSYVPGFDPSQTNKDNKARDWWTPMTTVRKLPKVEPMEETAAPSPTKWERWCKGPIKKLELSDSPMAGDGSLQSLLYYFNEESWNRFTKWAMNPTPLRIGHTAFNLTVAQRILTPGKWLGNEETDAMMYMWRENTTLRRWNIKRVAFMSALFCFQLDNAYRKFHPNKKAYELPDLFLAYGRGELPSHGRPDKVWGVDIDRLYFPLFVNVSTYAQGSSYTLQKRLGSSTSSTRRFTSSKPGHVLFTYPRKRLGSRCQVIGISVESM
ncbi:hypothetical protein Bca52824_075684 [Brassica carinata]|uniref:Uncharacterized protein n=1 Tax=Brassica carinata TaxID=52824 RepID=A0A8X7PSB8_BRACI|nr:hypothetical protein Bca52824_075684 [Brassica carinata]